MQGTRLRIRLRRCKERHRGRKKEKHPRPSKILLYVEGRGFKNKMNTNMEVIICPSMNTNVKNAVIVLKSWFLAMIKNRFPVQNAKPRMYKGY
jgi:hypothetical protein